jgi:hypothetical protein
LRRCGLASVCRLIEPHPPNKNRRQTNAVGRRFVIPRAGEWFRRLGLLAGLVATGYV